MAIDPKKSCEINGDGESHQVEEKIIESKQVNGHVETDEAVNGTLEPTANDTSAAAVNGSTESKSEGKDEEKESKSKSKPVVRYDE